MKKQYSGKIEFNPERKNLKFKITRPIKSAWHLLNFVDELDLVGDILKENKIKGIKDLNGKNFKITIEMD